MKVEPIRSPDQRKSQRELPIICDSSNYFIDCACNKLRIVEVQIVATFGIKQELGIPHVDEILDFFVVDPSQFFAC